MRQRVKRDLRRSGPRSVRCATVHVCPSQIPRVHKQRLAYGSGVQLFHSPLPSSPYFTPRALSCPTPACSGSNPPFLLARSTRDASSVVWRFPPTSPNPTRPIRRPCLMHITRSAHHPLVAGAFCTSAARARASHYVLSLDPRVLTPTARPSRRPRLPRLSCLPRTSRGLSTSSYRVPVRRPSPRISTSESSPSCHVSYCC